MAESERDEGTDTAKPAAEPQRPPAPIQPRRRALEVLVWAGGAAYASALIVPGCRFLTGESVDADGARWLRLIRLDALAEGEPTRVRVRGDHRDAFTVAPKVTLGSVWLTRKAKSVSALSAECPHLGCSVDLAPDKQSFACPCHASRFSLGGQAESGPAPRGMDALAARVTDGWVEVDFRRYRQGIAARIEVGA